MIKYETKSAYSNELINRTERGENNDSLYEDFIVVENMKSQFYYVFYGDGEPSVSSFEHDEKLPQTFDPRTGTLKQDLTVSEYKALVISHIDKISKKGEEYSRVKEVSVQRCIDDYKKMLKCEQKTMLIQILSFTISRTFCSDMDENVFSKN